MTTTPNPKAVSGDKTKKVESTSVEETPTQDSVSPEKSETPKIPDLPVSVQDAVVIGDAPGNTDYVHLSAIVVKNIFKKKSLSVHHLQRRLAELGYAEAYADKDAYYGDLTIQAVTKFQKDHGLEPTGVVTAVELEQIFRGDANVTVVLY